MEATTKLLNSSMAHALSHCIHLVANLNIADVMGRAEIYSSSYEIVEKLPDTVNVLFLQRILRFLCSDESSTEREDLPGFGLNAVSQLLRTDVELPSFRNLVLSCMALPQRNASDTLDSCIISEDRNKTAFVEGNEMDFLVTMRRKGNSMMLW